MVRVNGEPVSALAIRVDRDHVASLQLVANPLSSARCAIRSCGGRSADSARPPASGRLGVRQTVASRAAG